jgi:hypothetical protein
VRRSYGRVVAICRASAEDLGAIMVKRRWKVLRSTLASQRPNLWPSSPERSFASYRGLCMSRMQCSPRTLDRQCQIAAKAGF